MVPTQPPVTPAVARPVPGASWRARVDDAAAIGAALTRLWAQSEADQPVGVQARASTLNLTVVTRSRHGAEAAIDAVSRLSNLYPSRATILVASQDRSHQPEADRPGGSPGIQVEVTLLEQPAARGRPAVRFECITVEVSAENEQQLASITSPLLVADLPDFLWWASGPTGGDLFDDLVAITDRLIVDTADIADPSSELAHLSALVAREEGNLRLSDFAWARIEPWRHLVTQFFDPPPCRPVLEEIDEVTIAYGSDRSGTSALSSALLMAGWLASRLGWQAPGEMVPVRATPGAWRATLRAGDRSRRREMVLNLVPSDDRPGAAATGPSLTRVTLDAGPAAGRFVVERTDRLGVTTTSELAGQAPIARGIYAPVPDEAALLAAELHVFGRDLIYESALGLAAILAPELPAPEPAR